MTKRMVAKSQSSSSSKIHYTILKIRAEDKSLSGAYSDPVGADGKETCKIDLSFCTYGNIISGRNVDIYLLVIGIEDNDNTFRYISSGISVQCKSDYTDIV